MAELSDRSRDYRKQIKTSLTMLGELVGWDRLVQLIGAGGDLSARGIWAGVAVVDDGAVVLAFPWHR